MKISLEDFVRCTGARVNPTMARVHYDALCRAMDAFDISTPARVGMFLANIGHETEGLIYLTELWGPTPAQRRYERDFNQPWPANVQEAHDERFARNSLAWQLGNTEPGDGHNFRGHGHLQNTGRFNHAKVRDRLRARFPQLAVPDFEAEPYKLGEPEWAALAAGDYVQMKACNHMADIGDFDGYCDLINRGRKTQAQGDSNGYAARLALWKVAQPLLA